MATLRLFAAAREAAGEARADLPGATVADVLAAALDRYGDDFARILGSSRVWLNGQPANGAEPVSVTDTIAVLPPVSGGAMGASAPTDTQPTGEGPTEGGPTETGGGGGAVEPKPSVAYPSAGSFPTGMPTAGAMLTSRTELDRLSSEIARLTADLATFGQGSAADLVRDSGRYRQAPGPDPAADPQPTATEPAGEAGGGTQPGEGQAGEAHVGEGQAREGQPGEGQAGEAHVGEGQAGEGQAGEGQAGEGPAGEPSAGERPASVPQGGEPWLVTAAEGLVPTAPLPEQPTTSGAAASGGVAGPSTPGLHPAPDLPPPSPSSPVEAGPGPDGGRLGADAAAWSSVDSPTTPVQNRPASGVSDLRPVSGDSVWGPAPPAPPSPTPVDAQNAEPGAWTEATRPGWDSGVSFGSGPATPGGSWSGTPGWPTSDVTWATPQMASPPPSVETADIDDKWERIVAGSDDSPPDRDDLQRSAPPAVVRADRQPAEAGDGGDWSPALIEGPPAPALPEAATARTEGDIRSGDERAAETGPVGFAEPTESPIPSGEVEAGDLDFGDVEGVVKTWVTDPDRSADAGPAPAAEAAGGGATLVDDLIGSDTAPSGDVLIKRREPTDDATGRRSAPARTRPQRTPVPLAVVSRSTRAHGRLGLAWTVVTVAAILLGPGWAGLWLGGCAAAAALQTAKVWRARGERPLVPIAAAIGALIPLCAVSGPRAVTDGIVAAVVLALVARVFQHTSAPARDVALTLMAGLPVGLAAASVVLLRHIGTDAPLLLLAYAVAYDAAAYLVGTGARSVWEGPVAGVITLLPVALLSATVLVPPFPSGSPLLLGLVAAVLTPCGPPAASALLGEREVEAPALRRLDSLLVLAPAWAWCAAALLL